MSLQVSVATLTLVAGFGAALVSGVFFAFSTFVMAGLGRVEPAQGMRAMQGINETAVTPPFMILLFGTALVALALGGISLLAGSAIPGRGWPFAGLGIYSVGIVVVTIAGNVPMNDTLAGLKATESSGQAYWATYLSRWTRINHVRTVTSAMAAVAFFLAYLEA